MFAAIRPILFAIDPEIAHDLSLSILPACACAATPYKTLALALACDFDEGQSTRLETRALGGVMANPLVLAAGLDKNGLHTAHWRALGFGSVEIGSVTALSSKGNPRPRLFRLPDDQAAINRMGLNGQGATAIRDRLSRLSHDLTGSNQIVHYGINIARSNYPFATVDDEIQDVVSAFTTLSDIATASYFALNISCPNTHDGLKFEIDKTSATLSALAPVRKRLGKPLYIKISNDATTAFVDDLLPLIVQYDIAGLIVGNTSTRRDDGRKPLATSSARLSEIGPGGLSGRPLFARVLDLLSHLDAHRPAELELIACGGIDSADRVLEAIRAGAEAVQLYTAMAYKGPLLPIDISADLLKKLRRADLSIEEIKAERHMPGLRRLLGLIDL